MPYLRDRVIILRKEAFRESDRRYTMYGHEHGLLMAVARGSSRHSSKQAGHLEPFTESQVMIAKGAAFDKLAVASMIEAPVVSPGFASRIGCYAIAGAFADVVVQFSRPGIVDERVFFLLKEVLHVLKEIPASPSPDRARLLLSGAILKLLDVSGFAPELKPLPMGASPLPWRSLVRFMRTSPLGQLLHVTATIDVFRTACQFVDEALEHTPLQHELHGPRTLQALLG